jgi:hypothetical protein
MSNQPNVNILDDQLKRLESQISHLSLLVSSLSEGKVSMIGSPAPTLVLLDLLTDLALQLSALVRIERNNIDIFEDPLQRSDDLGNVRMIYKRSPAFRFLVPQLEEFAELVVEHGLHLKRLALSEHRTMLDYSEEWGTLDRVFPISEEIVVALESRTATRKLISRLYKESWRDKRQLRKKQRFVVKLQEQLRRKKLVISSLHQLHKKSRRIS